jgi:hypothetical protein
MNRAKPICPPGLYLRYEKDEQRRWTTVWLMERNDGGADRRVALIQEMQQGEVYLAFMTKRPKQPVIMHKDPQVLVNNACTLDRLL